MGKTRAWKVSLCMQRHATKGRLPIPNYPAGETVGKGLESTTRWLLYMSSAVEGEVR